MSQEATPESETRPERKPVSEREARLAAALRENLRRRKAQSRAREASGKNEDCGRSA